MSDPRVYVLGFVVVLSVATLTWMLFRGMWHVFTCTGKAFLLGIFAATIPVGTSKIVLQETGSMFWAVSAGLLGLALSLIVLLSVQYNRVFQGQSMWGIYFVLVSIAALFFAMAIRPDTVTSSDLNRSDSIAAALSAATICFVLLLWRRRHPLSRTEDSDQRTKTTKG